MHSLRDYWWQDPIFRKASFWALAVMVLSLAMLAGKVIAIISKPPPYQLAGIDRSLLEQKLQSATTAHTLVLFYEAGCDNCDVQIKHFLELKANDPQMDAIIISVDESAKNTGKYLRKIGIPDTIETFYAAPDARQDIHNLLREMGSGGIQRLPHSLVTRPSGKLLVEFSGYTRARQIQRTLELFNQ